MILEVLERENGFVSVFDDNGDVTIQMREDSVRKIYQAFDPYIKNREDKKLSVEVTEEAETFVLELSLLFEYDEDEFSLTGAVEGHSQYHDFDLEFCDVATWNKIGSLFLSEERDEKISELLEV